MADYQEAAAATSASTAETSSVGKLAYIRRVLRLMRMAWEANPVLAFATVSLRLVRAVLPIATLWNSKLILDALVGLLIRKSGSTGHIWNLVFAQFGLIAASDLLGRVNSVFASLLADRFTISLSVRLIRHANTLDLAAFEDPAFHDRLDRARRQSSGRLTLLTAVLNICQEMLSLMLLSAGLVSFNPLMTLVLVIAVVPSFLGEGHFSRLSYSILYRRTPERRLLDYFRYLGTSPQTAKEVRIFELGDHLAGRYKEAAESIETENRALAIRRVTVNCLLNAVSTLGYCASYAIFLAKVLSGAITVGTFTFLTGAFSRSSTAVERIFASLNDVAEEAMLLKDLFDFLEMKPAIQSAAGALPAPRPIKDGFLLQDVTFAYPGSSRPVLNRMNVRMHAGETVALVGENGAGKTTLGKLLTRLYEPAEGRILLDGVDLRDYDLQDLHRQTAVIFQDFMRYELPIRDNIGFGRIESRADQHALDVAAAKSLAKDFIARLPDGYDQVVGRRFEGGVELSGGEWQKLALARAYLREAQILILDEPSASLDPAAEFRLFQRLTDVARGRLVLLISHRFSTVRMADRIIVLANGTIREEGTHEQLLSLGGGYAQLFELHAAAFR